MSTREIIDFRTFVSICENGRAASACSCARRSFAAETVFMALVICRVLTTLRILRRMSRMLGMNEFSVPCSQFSVKSPPAQSLLRTENRELGTATLLLLVVHPQIVVWLLLLLATSLLSRRHRESSSP